MATEGWRTIEKSVTIGAGPLSLLGAENSFLRFRDQMPDASVVVVTVVNPGKNEAEEMLATLAYGSPDTLTRIKTINSTNAGAAVTWTGGAKVVMLSLPSYSCTAAERLRPAVRVATNANVPVASVVPAYVMDGIALAAGDRVLLAGQTTATENGIYIVAVAGAPTRALGFWAGDTVSGAIVPVRLGTLFSAALFICTSQSGADIVATSSLTFVNTGAGAAQGPGSSVNDAVAVFSGVTGKLLRSSTVLVHGANNDKLDYRASFKSIGVAVDAATISFNFDLNDEYTVTLGGNRTLAFTNASIGQRVWLRFLQDGTGSRTVTWWANIYWHGGSVPVFDTTPAGWDVIVLDCVGVDGYGVPVWVEEVRRSSGPETFSRTVNAAIASLTFTNQSNGNAALGRINMVNDTGSTVSMQMNSHEHATAPDQGYLFAWNGAASLKLGGDASAGVIEMGANTLGLYGVTPVVKRAGAAQAAVAGTGSTNTAPYGFTTAAQADAIVTLLNELRAALVALGAIKGSA